MKVFWHERQLDHAPAFFLQRGQLRPHFEVPDRARALLGACAAMGLDIAAPPPPERAALERVHPAEYLDFLGGAFEAWQAMPGAGPEPVPNMHPSPEMLAQGCERSGTIIGQVGWYVADTACPIGPHTWAAAEAAAACALAAAGEAAAGRHAYALARPPGHHAYALRAGGHCYMNNAAIAAEHLRACGAARVAVLDIDSHHGNGTQGIFWERPDVFFASVHGDPNRYYPWYVGHAGERGAGAGQGFNLNRPLPLGSGDAAWLSAIDEAVTAIRRFAPAALVLSLGFDASEHEPLNALSVTAEGFARAGERVAALGLPTAVVQEGGYAVEQLGGLLRRFLDGFLGGEGA
ncbi:histone deacetylase family protein [Roseomonas elaeocarpi]|uniref:Histone deacetylase family protein n=1 Tax=Roseomonas elaeocarpi TaxID=907779 RepID=A0ABV6JVN4_9PROT